MALARAAESDDCGHPFAGNEPSRHSPLTIVCFSLVGAPALLMAKSAALTEFLKD
jgi:hypothetical protein